MILSLCLSWLSAAFNRLEKARYLKELPAYPSQGKKVSAPDSLPRSFFDISRKRFESQLRYFLALVALKMTAFPWPHFTSFHELPEIIRKASTLMVIRRASPDADPKYVAFAADVLRLEVVGDTSLHLTVVDLPGLISVSDNDDEVRIMEDLGDKYLESSRTIILAVVPASNDIDTQGIIQRARTFDEAGLRTVGIITKPDLINTGTESRVASLAKNVGRIKLKLGFFLLKNPSPMELSEGISLAKRQQQEARFFSSTPWAEQNLDMSRIGIERLRIFLQKLLAEHIERELPRVREEVQALLAGTEHRLAHIGPERTSVGQVRMFLTQTSMDFYALTKAAVDGNYESQNTGFFNAASRPDFRLRAKVHIENERFATSMRVHASKRKICGEDEAPGADEASGEETEQLTSMDGSDQLTSTDESGESSTTENTQDSEAMKGQIRLSKKKMITWVERVRKFCV